MLAHVLGEFDADTFTDGLQGTDLQLLQSIATRYEQFVSQLIDVGARFRVFFLGMYEQPELGWTGTESCFCQLQ